VGLANYPIDKVVSDLGIADARSQKGDGGDDEEGPGNSNHGKYPSQCCRLNCYGIESGWLGAELGKAWLMELSSFDGRS
jgi:hypothetical protein